MTFTENYKDEIKDIYILHLAGIDNNYKGNPILSNNKSMNYVITIEFICGLGDFIVRNYYNDLQFNTERRFIDGKIEYYDTHKESV